MLVYRACVPGIGKNPCPASVSRIGNNDSARKGEAKFTGVAGIVHMRPRKGGLRLGGSTERGVNSLRWDDSYASFAVHQLAVSDRASSSAVDIGRSG